MISRMIDCVSVTQKQLRKAQSLEEAGPKINKEISLIMAFIEKEVDKVSGFPIGYFKIDSKCLSFFVDRDARYILIFAKL